ncbi:MAG TPA: preprotein translocase subunit YajC [Microbacterium sp.]|nr:preprotein translocase subunit YajC [Microbacterium sp.]
MDFFAQYGLLILLAVLLVFMFWSSRRRTQRMKAEQEQKARQTVPGAEVLLQGGLYGRVVSYDTENLDEPAIIELAPGVQIKVHSQAILRVVTPTDTLSEEEFLTAEEHQAEYAADVAEGYTEPIGDSAPHIETPEETAERLTTDDKRQDKTED